MAALEMQVDQLAVDPVLGAAVVILLEKGGERAVPIWVGQVEAAAIISELRQVPMARPMTHDLLNEAIFRLRAEVDHVIVTDFQNGTFYAEVVLCSVEGDIRLDARPSDAIALALRANARILVEREVVEDEWCVQATARLGISTRRPRPIVEVSSNDYEALLSNLEDEDFGKWKM